MDIVIVLSVHFLYENDSCNLLFKLILNEAGRRKQYVSGVLMASAVARAYNGGLE